ncbi:NAD(P)/FAD-dependent oxidoreductase [Alkaliphilus transvaalensis]|uniref:NAD(P)/FAD-dependent oxidoreductase n=1 Tax=Alkaliphilus transvaalensis TaxID=114628 RepID=UPI00047E61F1|nr:NAD(P)/FAD-dependent oxidoreductase [Alkaliphilus transvaalensis]
MKIAIMGGGLSGLACGFMLEKEGIKYDLFEAREGVDDRFRNGEIFLSILNTPIDDCISYFSEEFGIYLQPVGHIKELHIYSEKEKAIIKGSLGFNVARGRSEDSIVNQLKNQIKTPIHYHSKYTYEALLKEYTHVVIATGDGAYSEALGNYKTNLTVTLKGLIVEGEFDRYTSIAWLDNRFAPKGYGYLIPLSNTEANVVLAYPDYPENDDVDSNQLMRDFIEKVQLDLNQKLKEVDGFQVTKYMIGHCLKPRIGNTFFVGNCFGAIMPFLGFGQFSAIMTGIYAAYDLAGKGKYEDSIVNLKKSYENSLVLRKGMEKLDNKKFDLMVKGLNNELGDRLLGMTNINLLEIISKVLKPFIKL